MADGRRKKLVLIIADSMAMPRTGVPYGQTWPYRLRTSKPQLDFIDKTRRASTALRLNTEGGGDSPDSPAGADLLEHYRPDIIILQVGITDCAPRYFDKNSLSWKVFSNLVPASARRWYIRHLKRHGSRSPSRADVKPQQFVDALEKFFGRAQAADTRVLVIPIAPVTGEFVRKSPLINSCIDKYNAIYAELAEQFENVQVLDPFRGSDVEDMAVDEFHVNWKGHALVAQELERHL